MCYRVAAAVGANKRWALWMKGQAPSDANKTRPSYPGKYHRRSLRAVTLSMGELRTSFIAVLFVIVHGSPCKMITVHEITFTARP